uniref:uncharacterized protein LOC120343544 n=1 Tax=Styela clava TaxID=7725 RepID=UPI00193A8FFC|nr:uncharacterized protein LOC120343544 [Styela clava]
MLVRRLMWKRKESRIWVRPSDVRYTQDSILPYFQDGDTIMDVARKIAQKKLNVDDIPLIKIVKKEDKFWSLDNRRLYLFKLLQTNNLLDLVEARHVDISRLTEEKFTTENNGKSARLRSGIGNSMAKHAAPQVTPESIVYKESSPAPSRGSYWLYYCFMLLIAFVCLCLIMFILRSVENARRK